MNYSLSWLLILLHWGFPCFGFPQDYEFEHLTDRDGLVGNTITAITKDSKGFIWIGTNNGLSKYDGYNFTNYTYDPKNPVSIMASRIKCLFETRNNVLLIGTYYGGLTVYDHNSESFKTYRHEQNNSASLSHDYIRAIYQDKKGDIWIGTIAGLDKFDLETGNFYHYKPFKTGAAEYISSICEDQNGNLYLYGYTNSIAVFNPQRTSFSYITFTDKTLAETAVEKFAGGVMFYDSLRQFLYLGKRDLGVCKINLKNQEKEWFTKENGKFSTNQILHITGNSEGNILIGSDGSGLYEYNPETKELKNYHHKPGNYHSLSNNKPYYIYESEPGILWIGNYAGGLNILKKYKKKFDCYTSSGDNGTTLSNSSVLSVAEGPGGKIWIGTDGGGLNVLNPSTKQISVVSSKKTGLFLPEIIKCMAFDHYNNLWCGSYRKGLFKYNPGSGAIDRYSTESTDKETRLRRDIIWSVCYTLDDKLWLGYLTGGVQVFDILNKKVIDTPLDTIAGGEFASTTIYAIIQDKKGRIWIGSEKFGAICYDLKKNRIQHYFYQQTSPAGKTSNEIRDIFEDSKGNIWFASAGGSLDVLIESSGKIQHYGFAEGLPSNYIQSIIEDQRGNIWVSTNNGLSYLDIKSNEFVNFNLDDGLQGKEFNQSSRCISKEGEIYFGGIEGLNSFHPESLKFNHKPPKVLITGFRIFNKVLEPNKKFEGQRVKDHIYLKESVNNCKEIELFYQDNIFSIEFAAFCYTAPSKTTYAYRLKGFDQGWTFVNADKRFATYTNLNPGTYNFQVIASNNDNIWNREGAELTIHILPPWWMTWWFKLLATGVFILGVCSIVYLRTKGIKKQNRLLEQEVRKRTLELNQVNENLLQMNKEMLEKNQLLELNNQDISRKTDRILEQQEEILKQKEKLERLNRTKDKFLSIISHDLRNPVNALVVLTKLLHKEFENAGKSGKELITHINISAERIKVLLLNLLEWSKSQTEQIVPQPEKISVKKIVDENILLHQIQAVNKNISVESQIDPSHFVYADYNMLSAIIRNLISNNIKYSHKEGLILIKSEQTDENRICISFSDQGMGMSQKFANGLLNANLKISSIGTENEEGTGLGMIISREFTTLNNGFLSIKSIEGEGTTFFLELPGEISYKGGKENLYTENTFYPQTERFVPEALIKEEFKGMKVLLVDDDEQIRRTLKFLLADIFQVFEATNVNSAVNLSEEVFPDLIISDIVMPGESGISLCQRIKMNKITSHIPVILLTGQESEEVHFEGLVAGADSYIVKPFDRKILLTTINNLLNNLAIIRKKFTSDPEILPAQVAKADIDKELLEKAVLIIEKHLSNSDLNGDFLCKELGMSKSLLYVKLKNLTGQTVNEFIRIIRLKKSTSLLQDGRFTISQVASEVGFNSASYFTRSFVQHFGITPKEFIERNSLEKDSFLNN